MSRVLKRGLSGAFAVFSVLMTFLPESFFSFCHVIKEEMLKNISWLDTNTCNIIIARGLLFLDLFVLLTLLSWLYSLFKKVKIKGNNYYIVVEYGDLLKKENCQRVINFDECFTTKVGSSPADIKEDTICGQYLTQNPQLNVEELISTSGVKPCRRKSKYKNLTCYEPGTIVPNGDDLLMAFTRLESNGIGMKFTVEEYLKCLSRLWKEIDANYCNKDVCVPVLGSGIARFENGTSPSIPKQELVNLMIASYKLSPHKLKNNNILHIVCWKQSDNFSMDKVIG